MSKDEKDVRSAIDRMAKQIKQGTRLSYTEAKEKARETARRVESRKERKK